MPLNTGMMLSTAVTDRAWVAPGQVATAAGWGRTTNHNHAISTVLKQVDMTVATPAGCKGAPGQVCRG